MTFTKEGKPRDMVWHRQLDMPAVMQLTVKPGVRITWNPDDDRFYVETNKNEWNEWHTSKTFKGNVKGWDNAKYHGRNLA